ncbi:MAG: glycoside hydrolase family 25 protein [Bacilli bacterium]|nr:glycoside hydrolase family 25 protein [Bacilli bacterium]
MDDTKNNKLLLFILQHKGLVVFLLCLVIVITMVLVFADGYSKRIEDDFSELQTYIFEIKEKDKDIYNNLKVREIKKDVQGIDVSSWQKEIDWELVKESGIDFVMIRCGYRNLTNDDILIDPRFEYNISEANRLDIPVGVYFYSTARDEKEVLEEASFVLHTIKDYDITYPVVYDFELYNQKRMEGISASEINDNAIRFLEYMSEHGYRGMIYSNRNYLNKVWDIELFDNYKFWLAQYDGELMIEHDMIQYSDKGTIPGISVNVDLNRANFAYERVES